MSRELNEEELQDLYAWIDKIPLSRPKRHITRDFSDGGSQVSLLAWLAILVVTKLNRQLELHDPVLMCHVM